MCDYFQSIVAERLIPELADTKLSLCIISRDSQSADSIHRELILRYCNTRRVRKMCLDGASYGETRDVQARIFRTGGRPASTVFNGSTLSVRDVLAAFDDTKGLRSASSPTRQHWKLPARGNRAVSISNF
jgi:hypothetical protein